MKRFCRTKKMKKISKIIIIIAFIAVTVLSIGAVIVTNYHHIYVFGETQGFFKTPLQIKNRDANGFGEYSLEGVKSATAAQSMAMSACANALTVAVHISALDNTGTMFSGQNACHAFRDKWVGPLTTVTSAPLLRHARTSA